MPNIIVVSNSRAESSPLDCVIRELPEARVVTFVAEGEPHEEMADALRFFHGQLAGADIVVLLGDRYETLAAGLAATFLRVPIAHLHGGETTTGAFDDGLRHSLTHLTEQSGGLHLAATPHAAERITQMTNGSQRVHVVGAPGLDGVQEGSARRDRDIVVVGFHPETQAADYGVALCRDMLACLNMRLPSFWRIVFTGVNKDPGHEQIEALINEFCEQHPSTRIVAPLPRDAYILLLQEARLIIGNSSSIPIEASWIGTPGVLVGARQDGREFGRNIFQADGDMTRAIDYACMFEGPTNAPYRGGEVGKKIAEIVRGFVNA